MAKHYHVLVGMRGLYMPDVNEAFGSRKEAEASARAYADQMRDQGDPVSGSARQGYLVGDDYSIEIADCAEADCLADLEAS